MGAAEVGASGKMEAPAPGAVQIQKHSRFEPTGYLEEKKGLLVELDECDEWDTLSHLLSF